MAERAVLDAAPERVWAVLEATDRYAEWVDGVLAVLDHHGTAAVGGTYRERNRTVGPLRTTSVWTVLEIEPLRRRVDGGTGFAPLHDLVDVFELEPAPGGRTAMTYAVRHRAGLGPAGRLLDRLQRPALRRAFRRSMRNLEALAGGDAGRAADPPHDGGVSAGPIPGSGDVRFAKGASRVRTTQGGRLMLDDDDIETGTGDGGADGPAEPGPEGPADGGAGGGDGGADGPDEGGPEGPADGGA